MDSITQSIKNAESYLQQSKTTSSSLADSFSPPQRTTTISKDIVTTPSETSIMQSMLNSIRSNNGLDVTMPESLSSSVSEDSLENVEVEEKEDTLFYASDVNCGEAPAARPPAVAWTLELDPMQAQVQAPQQLKPRPKLTSEIKATATTKSKTIPRQPIIHTKSLSSSAVEGIESEKLELTFKPQITTQARNRPNANVHERLSKLAEQMSERQRQRESQKITESAKTARSHSFKPEITSKGSKRAGNVMKTARSLYHDADERNMIRECTRYHLQEQKMSEYTFQPQVNAGKGKGGKPIYKRVDDIQREKQEKMSLLRQSVIDGENLTFQPVINDSNNSNSKNNDSNITTTTTTTIVDEPTGQRLHSENARHVEKQMKRVEKFEQEQREQNTFKPQICERTEKLGGTEKGNFMERQAKYLELVEGKRQSKERERGEKFRQYFKPKIGKSERIVEKKRRGQVVESVGERVERLSVKDQEEMDNRKELRLSKEYGKYDFQPEINSVSKALMVGRKPGIEELSENPRGRGIKERIRREAEAKFEGECTFRPEVRPGPEFKEKEKEGEKDKEKERLERIDLKNIEDLTLNVSRYNADREEKRLEKIRQREIEELKDCTFQPKLNIGRKENCNTGGNNNDKNNNSYVDMAASKRAGGKAVVVRGLGRYLELKHLAKQKENDQKERERKAYSVQKIAGDKYPDGTTQIKEFRISKGGGDELKKKLKTEREEYLRQQCTFQPDTIEKRNRAIIAAMLEDDEEE